MISDKLAERFVEWGQNLKSAQEQLISLLREGVVEIGGKQWIKKPLQPMFDQLEADLLQILCVSADGPRIRKGLFRSYFRGGRNALIFGIPFYLGMNIANGDLDRVLQLVMEDKSDRTREQKFRTAVAVIREEKRPAIEIKPSIRIPLLGPKEDVGEWLKVFRSLMAELFTDKEIKRHRRGEYAFEIRRLELALIGEQEEEQVRRIVRRAQSARPA
jgi:hypothetical protein